MFDFSINEYFNTVPLTSRPNTKMLQWLSHLNAACRPKVMFVGPNNSKTKQKVFTLNQLLPLKHELLVKSKE